MEPDTTDALYPNAFMQEDALDAAADVAIKHASKGGKIGEIILDLLLYTGELIVPIILWSCVIAILAGFVQRANWTFWTRTVFYGVIAIICLFFLLVRHGADHVIADKLATCF